MKRSYTFHFLVLLLATASGIFWPAKGQDVPPSSSASADVVGVIPRPMTVARRAGAPFVWDRQTLITIDTETLRAVSEQFARSMGRPMSVVCERRDSACLQLLLDKRANTGDEGYTLDINERRISIVAQKPAGIFYALQTLRQILETTAASNARKERSTTLRFPESGLKLSPIYIQDVPRFSWRGMMIDPCRHFLPMDEIKKRIDVMARFKMNRLHLHLTDDQGWRIEIKRYPYLTKTGAKRIEGDSSTYGPYFYTWQEIKDLVAYAAERYITVVPEIEMPGHGMAAIAAYPWLTCFPEARDYKVRNIWGVEDDVYCAGRESTYRFLSDVIDEVAPLFPGKYFHIGGDECPKDQWRKCPVCNNLIRKKGLKDVHGLQSYVIRRAEEMLARHGKQLIGWDEILEGGLAPSATVMSWRGEDGGIVAAGMGHDVVMTPASGGLYLDHYQGDPKVEPLAIGGYAPLSKTYAYNPIPKQLPLSKHKHILGVQGNLWSEYMYTPEIQSYRSFPRIIAIAEIGWTRLERKDFESFCHRLQQVAYPFLDELGLSCHIPLPEQPGGSISQIAFVDSYALRLQTALPGDRVAVRVMDKDGTVTPPWQFYPSDKDLLIDRSCTVEAKTVMSSGRESRGRKIRMERQAFGPALALDTTKLLPGLLLSTFYVPQYHQIFPLATDSTLLNFMRQVKIDRECSALNWLELRNDAIRRQANGSNLVRVAVAVGYVYIPRDGVYAFSTNNKELWIDDILLVDNTLHPKKESSRDGSRALAQGYHPIKVVFFAAVEGGWPSWWDNGDVLMRRMPDEKYQPISFATLRY